MSEFNPLVRFVIPASFVLAHAMPTGGELAMGFREGWLRREDVVEIALAKYKAGVPMQSSEAELALLLSDDLLRVEELVGDLEVLGRPVERRARFWLFMALAWLLEHRDEYEDPFRVIEMIYADFDYPPEIDEFVGFMPALPGRRGSRRAMLAAWQAFVTRVGIEYRERDLAE